MAMLPQEEKDRILAEESYRYEVREGLGKQFSSQPRSLSFWEVLNSAFFLWLLSSVVLGSASFIYTKWETQQDSKHKAHEEKQEFERERARNVRKLDTEIAARLTYFNVLYRTDPSQAILALEDPMRSGYPASAFPEFKGRNFHSLLWELIDLVDESQKPELRIAYEASKMFPTIYVLKSRLASHSGRKIDSNKELSTIRGLGDRFLMQSQYKSLNLNRWGSPLDLLVGYN
jgi:hypothetical protein